MSQKVAGSIPGQGTCLVCGPGPQLRTTDQYFSLTSMFLSFSFPFPSPHSEINKHVLKLELKKRKVKEKGRYEYRWKNVQHHMSLRKRKLKQYHPPLPEWPKRETLPTPKAGRVWNDGSHALWACRTAQPLYKTVEQLLAERNRLLSYDPAIMLLGIYPNEWKTYVHTKSCIWMFIAASLILPKLGRNQDGPPEVKRQSAVPPDSGVPLGDGGKRAVKP